MTAAALQMTITTAGLAAVIAAQGDGLQATIIEIAVGKGEPAGADFVGYEPVETATALVSEAARVPLISGQVLAGKGFRVQAQVPATEDVYTIREIGAFLSDGTLLALWSDPTQLVAATSPLADINFAVDLNLAALPLDALAITVLEPDVPDLTPILAELLAAQAANHLNHIELDQRCRAAGI
ncbi:hypothetical protein HDIA_2280 [Hartmannibacter diazotrophicus]|uniref:Phage tail fibre protein N-terminal domain-containing protein n=1 Tax=Hartmannibacter diazotrophicus TaxID=1482074 RepID=A0A2C9D7U7_9HYPH|nr:phage tail protein [Hartmannibacter diazotrophicus]SON55821.1 hypothetical protein HDIA_2280 [Hartmannibacter diazotrophicus]